MSLYSSTTTASSAASEHAAELRKLKQKLSRTKERLAREQEKSKDLETRLADAEQRIADAQAKPTMSLSSSTTTPSSGPRTPLTFASYKERLQKQYYTYQQQELIIERLMEFEEEFRGQEREYALAIQRQDDLVEEQSAKDERIKDLQAELDQARAELSAKDRHIHIIDAQLKEARGTGRFSFLSSSKSSSGQQDSTNVQALIADLRERCTAHQEQTAVLARELRRNKEISDSLLKAKTIHIEELSRQLGETFSSFQELRKKYMFASGIEEDVLSELEAVRRELFYALALGIKLSMASTGGHSNLDVAQLYDEAKSMHYSSWNEWILRRIDEARIGNDSRLATDHQFQRRYRS